MSEYELINISDGISISDAPVLRTLDQQYLEIGLCQEGYGSCSVLDKNFMFSAGAISVVPCNHHYALQSAKASISIWTFLRIDVQALRTGTVPETVIAALERMCGPRFQHVIPAGDESSLARIIAQLISELRMHAQEKSQNLQSLLQTMLIHLSRLPGQFSGSIEQDVLQRQDLQALFDYVHCHYMETSISKDLINAFDYKHMQSTCKSYCQKSIEDLVQQKRLHHICDLLQHTAITLDEIPQLVAFDGERNHQQIFENVYGCSMASYRRSKSTR